MPYEGEFASYRSIRRIVEAERVQKLLNRARVFRSTSGQAPLIPKQDLPPVADLPGFVLAIDGSYAEVDVRTGYPGAKVGYVTVASVLLDLDRVSKLDECRPIDPQEFRKTEQADTIDSALPGSNVVTLNQNSARSSFRQEVYEVFHDVILDDVDRVRFLTTYEELLQRKPSFSWPGMSIPRIARMSGPNCRAIAACQNVRSCKRPVFSTDALRIHERFRDLGTNGEAFGLVMQVWERILLIHFLRCFERQGLLGRMGRLAFFMDGPLGVLAPPHGSSAAISTELKRLNGIVRAETGNDLVIIGVEKSGNFVAHFDEIDRTENPGEKRFCTPLDICCSQINTSRSESLVPIATRGTGKIRTSGGSSSTRQAETPRLWGLFRS